MERETLQHLLKIEVDTCIKLELTRSPSALACCIVVGEHISLVSLTCCEEILTIDDVARCTDIIKCRTRIRIDSVDWHKWHKTVRTEGSCFLPIVLAYWRLRVVVGSSSINETAHIVAESEIDITTHIKTVCVVVLGSTEVHIVAYTIVAYIAVELSKLVTTSDFSNYICTVISLLDIVRRVEIHISIAVRILL